ncbi:MAG: hypothetical protein EBV77_04835 [Gemmatimonadaceae bacterium]|nr:hypothetical protein [Gemmatimonadaceae bacterium]
MSVPIPPAALTRLTLPALVAQWARMVDYLARHPVSADEFVADVLVRHEIAQRLRAKPTTLETREMLAEIDEQFRSITEESAGCVAGAPRSAAEAWSAGREWYFWRARRAG